MAYFYPWGVEDVNAELIVAVAVPTGVVVGWLTKHFQSARNGRPSGHQAKVEGLLREIRDHVASLPLLSQRMEQHDEATRRANELVIELAADMKARQRRGE